MKTTNNSIEEKKTNGYLMMIIAIFTIITLLSIALNVSATERTEMLPYGNMDSWVVRNIKESILLGGNTRTLYAIGPTDTICENKPYPYGKGGSPWGTSNAYAKVAGVEKAACSVTPEKRGNGYCCRLETTLQTITAVGIDLKALATGSLFIGKLSDPVGMDGAKNPAKAINMGMRFTKRPVALMLDYKTLIQESNTMQRANASAKVKTVQGHDEGEIVLFLQQRWEDEDGNIFAYRIGTASEHISKSVSEWQNDHRLIVRYGDISKLAGYESWEALTTTRFMARNSKGKMVYVQEIGYKADAEPTHLILQISSGCQEPFTGCAGNVLWVDNIRLVY